MCIACRYKYIHASIYDGKEGNGKREGEMGSERDIDMVLGKIYSSLEISFHIFREFILLRIN